MNLAARSEADFERLSCWISAEKKKNWRGTPIRSQPLYWHSSSCWKRAMTRWRGDNGKIRLVKGLYERGLAAEEVRQLFRLLDWMLALPVELEQQFQEELH